MQNTTSPFNGFEFISKKRVNITSGVYSVLAISAAFNIFTCPLAIVLNSLVIVAVKTKRCLRTKSNISLACLLRAAQDPFLRRNVFATQLRLDTGDFTR